MARSINKVTLMGNLGADPEVHVFQNGDQVANLRIATSQTWKDHNTGERREKTEWHHVSVKHQGFAKAAEKFLKKGSRVIIEGKLETRKWEDKDGNTRYSTEVVVNGPKADLIMLDSKPKEPSYDGMQETDQNDLEGAYEDEIPY